MLLLIFLISSCSGTKKLTHFPELTIANQQRNKLIIDRKPDYGLGRRDGCISMDEISMEITALDNGKSICGKIFNARTKEPIVYATLQLSINDNGLDKKLEIHSNKNGIYQTELKGKLKKIEVDYIGYRTLIIDLKKL